jgi:hypothetical protein
MKNAFPLLVLIITLPLTGQETVPQSDPISIAEPEDSLTVAADSSIASDSSLDSVAVKETPKKKNVTTAMLLSTFIPGGGQFYNQSYIKGVLVAGGEATLGYFTVREHMRMLSARDTNLVDSVKQDIVDQIRFRRNTYAFFTGMIIAYAVADAFVDAHMFGFRQQQRLTVAPTVDRLGLALRYRF